MLPARMRNGAGWSDACILNISSGGLLVYAESGAAPGTRIELRRGGQMVVGRVVWRNNNRIGVCSTHPLRVEEIISTETAASALASAVRALTAGAAQFERRQQGRDPNRSRARSRAIEFLSLVLIGTALAGAAAAYAQQTLGKPLAAATKALASS